MAVSLLLLLSLVPAIPGEQVRHLEVSEAVPVGIRVGFISNGTSDPPYLIVPVGSAIDSDLSIDETTGEIRTKVKLDRETRANYALVAIPARGENVKVVVKVLDENDNAPIFPTAVMNIEFPENTPRDVKRTLHPAKDLDLDVFNTQKYNIVSGNVNNAFRLSSHRERDGVLYLDLQINGFLDRETVAAYSLVIEALDGGSPPLRGEMTVNITIQDVNDNQPIFNESRYFGTVAENATIGTSVIQVFATDSDAGENGKIRYSINRRQSDKENMFRIDSVTGLITVNKPLDFEIKELHELVVVATDNGLQPLETTTFVSIKVTDVNDNQPTINVIFLSDDATPKISESAQPGEFVARISVNDPDSKTEYSNVNVTLTGGDGRFGLTTRDQIIYLMIVSLPLDRELQPNYTLNVVATDNGNPPLHASRTIKLKVTDINDNAPEFQREVYHANVMEVSDPGTSVVQVLAIDKDEGNNSAITYELGANGSSWFEIDPRSGLITTRAHVDCETEPRPELVVIATDSGFPPLSSTARVLVTIHDVNDNEPIFDQSFYNATVAENETPKECILKVSATDPDCGVNAIVNYTLGEGFGNMKEFTVKSDTGDVCVASDLDFETRNIFEFPVVATDRGGLSTTAMVKIQLTDVNDNRPVFYPREYNVSLGEGTVPTDPLLAVQATDADSGKFGTVRYEILEGVSAELFRIDRDTGEISLNQGVSLGGKGYRLVVGSVDGGGLSSMNNAVVYISVIDARQKPPIFEQARYGFEVAEDVAVGTVVGRVKAVIIDSGSIKDIRYSIYSGDPNGYFKIDPVSGEISSASELDYETKSNVLLNIQATSGTPPVYGHTQVSIDVTDTNDNPPFFPHSPLRISLPESHLPNVPFLHVRAIDRDSRQNGQVVYRLTSPSGGPFEVDARTGAVQLRRSLDYEARRRYQVLVTARDGGKPQREGNVTVLVEVQDVNDHEPIFERKAYDVVVDEGNKVNTKILQVTAIDHDTGNNARLTYSLPNCTTFGIFPDTGWLYLRRPLDRETVPSYRLPILASDHGTPALTATATVSVTVGDINDLAPVFIRGTYKWTVEEGVQENVRVGAVEARDGDLGKNGLVRYSVTGADGAFEIDEITGEIRTKSKIDREKKEFYDLVVEARDQGLPSRSTRVPVKIQVSDVNDNAPEILDPQEDVVSVREEQPPGTEVVKIRAVDPDKGNNATITYSILKGKDIDGYGVFTIDPSSGVVRTRMALDHEEKTIYRLAVAATDNGSPSKQTVRMLRVEVLDLNDNRPTFTSSSLVFRVRENVNIGFIVGSVTASEPLDEENLISTAAGGHITYALTSLMPDNVSAFDIDRSTGYLVVTRELDREKCSEYHLEVRALDTSAINNPQSSAVTVRVDIADVNDNYPQWSNDPITFSVREDVPVGSIIFNLTASDADSGSNADIKYALIGQYPSAGSFSVDSLTGSLMVTAELDYETIQEYILIVMAMDQSSNVSERLNSSATVKVVVTDCNDNQPKFVIPNSLSVPISKSTTVGMTVAHLIAADRDSGDNGRVTYIISSGNDEHVFSLGYDTGLLTLTRPLLGNLKTYRMNITATDHGTPTNYDSIELKLTVDESEDEAPKFIDSFYRATIREDAAIGTLVISLKVESTLNKNGNLSFILPNHMEEFFNIDRFEGDITTNVHLDREDVESFTIPVYVADSSTNGKTYFDIITVVVTVTDVNDHAPEFQPGSCYRLYVPENSEPGVIHTVVAKDLDVGSNGMITYSITGGNVGNRFSIDRTSGKLSAKSLDRETVSRYTLAVTAQDMGSPALRSGCNVTVVVEDQNDNDPKFDTSKYSTLVPEDVPAGHSVLQVRATDIDAGTNGKIVYSLANETQWLFQIDNKSGVITTTGLFDRETQDRYSFLVVASDRGKSNARTHKVPVTVLISDVNDNKPEFTSYPLRTSVSAYIQPGNVILSVSATDKDEGSNSEIAYTLDSSIFMEKFHINSKTGRLTASQSLSSENGKIIHLTVVATDRGNPPMSSRGLVEIMVGDHSYNSLRLDFKNGSYEVSMLENSEQFSEVLQVSAVRSDGRRQPIVYSFGTGNEDDAFQINPSTGLIQVRDSRLLDYEARREIDLVVEGKSESEPVLYGYCNVLVRLLDQNDNSPKFSQLEYTASVLEGDNKDTFVLKVQAFDSDEGVNSRVLYHIVDGNHDNAFKIESAFSGILKTNIALDREIRDSYRLTIIATDEGVPQMTGTARIKINVLDINDNIPTFPPHNVITVSEATEIGTVLITMSANDVDTYPALTYTLAEENDEEVEKIFSIDRFSGKITLRTSLDYERKQEYQIKIRASDMDHAAETILTIEVADINDNAPVFSQTVYTTTIPENIYSSIVELLVVNASDVDTGDNSRIKYSLVNSPAGFLIEEATGIIHLNTSYLAMINRDLQLTVQASDHGQPALSSFTTVFVKLNGGFVHLGSGNQREYRIKIAENALKGTKVLSLEAYGKNRKKEYRILAGNDGGNFEISNSFGSIVLVNKLDRELKNFYKLKISVGDISYAANVSSIIVLIDVEDVNDNAPIFAKDDYEISIPESTPVGNSIVRLSATDSDASNTVNSEIRFDITSGNDAGHFRLDERMGILHVNKILDFDAGHCNYSLVIRACDRGKVPLCTLRPLLIKLSDDNDNEPKFPVSEYLEFVGENEPIGTAVFTAQATDLDKGVFGALNYSIQTAGVTHFNNMDDSWKMFNIDQASGLVVTNAVFDYEQRNRFIFNIKATDIGGKSSIVKVVIRIESRDEFHPQFTERTYKFTLPTSVNLPAGYVVGHVTATDRDKGPDGRVVYQFTTQHSFLKINRTTGAVMLKKKLDQMDQFEREMSLVVTAGSGRQGSLTNMTVVEIILDPLADPGTNLAISKNNSGGDSPGGLADWALGLLIALILLLITFGAVFVFLHLRNKRNKKINKPNLGSDAVSSSNNYVDPGAFDTIPIRGSSNVLSGSNNQFAPPKYDEIPQYGPVHPASSNSGAATTSELSGSEQSNSSGRGSAEDGDDGEDEEIRMINEGPRQRDTGMHPDRDNLSDVSICNTQEYLARLGIVNNNTSGPQIASRLCPDPRSVNGDNLHHHQTVGLESLHMFDEENGNDSDMNLIYAKLNDVAASDRASSTGEGAGSSTLGPNMDHVMAIGGYGEVTPVTHQPSMNGSLSSIVHSEEELAGSYNWDYLLDWGPQYQPLAHVFSEIARLKDDTASVKSTASGNSSIKSKNSMAQAKSIPPPLITSVAPRAITMPILSARGGSSHHGGHNQIMLLPRSPINHDASGETFTTSTAMSPSFSPSLSPLATKSPSISPLVAPGLTTTHHVMSRQIPQKKTVVDTELRI